MTESQPTALGMVTVVRSEESVKVTPLKVYGRSFSTMVSSTEEAVE